MRGAQLLATAAVLRRVVSPVPLASAVIVGVVLALASNGDTVVLRIRFVIALLVAASVVLLDDAAASTLAPSPTPLGARRSFRIAAMAALVGASWSLIIGAAAVRVDDVPAAALGSEVIVLLAVAIVASLIAQRWSDDGRGASAGGLAAVGWFVASFLPRMHWVPLPPNPIDSGSAGAMTAIAIVALAFTLALSRDPAGRWRARPSA